MKKAFLNTTLAVLAALTLGCSATPASPEAGTHEAGTPEEKTGYVHKEHMSHEKVLKAIMKAGEENGWIMTLLNSHTIIAENVESDKVSTIKFNAHSFDISPENANLENILSDALN